MRLNIATNIRFIKCSTVIYHFYKTNGQNNLKGKVSFNKIGIKDADAVARYLKTKSFTTEGDQFHKRQHMKIYEDNHQHTRQLSYLC